MAFEAKDLVTCLAATPPHTMHTQQSLVPHIITAAVAVVSVDMYTHTCLHGSVAVCHPPTSTLIASCSSPVWISLPSVSAMMAMQYLDRSRSRQGFAANLTQVISKHQSDS